MPQQRKCAPARDRQGWTLVLLCLGIGTIACCVLIPQADENRLLHWESEKLRVDLDHLKKQTEVNAEFLKRVDTDPALAERLAQRQMKFVRKGAGVLELKGVDEFQTRSPFLLTTVPEPPPIPPYQPVAGPVADFVRDTKQRLYAIGAGLMLLAMGLVLGHNPARR